VPTFEEHLAQAKRNLDYLQKSNELIPDRWDWQVTVCFYVGVHLVNAHVFQKTGQHYRSHEQVNMALNPATLSLAKLSESDYLAYKKLQGLARRARYLCHDDPQRVHFKTSRLTLFFNDFARINPEILQRLDMVRSFEMHPPYFL
jgi:hypothetical protein